MSVVLSEVSLTFSIAAILSGLTRSTDLPSPFAAALKIMISWTTASTFQAARQHTRLPGWRGRNWLVRETHRGNA